MFGSRFFWKLYASYAALVILTTAVTGFLVHGRMERALLERLERSMEDGCALLVPYAQRAFAGTLGADPDPEAVEMGEHTGMRLTLIAADGSILADSDQDPAKMENHGARPEVTEAVREGRGTARRHSKSVRQDMLYFARRVGGAAEPVGIVRLSVPLGDVQAQLAQMRARVAVGGAVGCAVALVLGLFVARRITNPIVGITQTAEALREGRYESRVRHLPSDEIGILGDTLNRMAAEVRHKLDAISDEDAQLRAVLEGMVESVIAVDASDRIVFINGAACRMLGTSESAAVGRGIWELVRLADLEDLLAEVRSSGRASRCDLLLDREGKEARQEVYATPLTVSSKSPGVVIVMHDVTQIRRLESMRRDFVANVSHELKTPLTSIRGYVETLLDGALEDEENNVRFLEKIETHVVRLNHLVSDLLSLGRIEAQQEELVVGPVDWSELVRDAVRRHERQARGRGLTCTVSLPEARVRVQGDAESMTQVVDNLLDNAIKYTPEGGAVELSLSREGGEAVLRVRDTGIGIPAEDLDRIFERFYRVDKARSREVGGTGLGLSIVKHLVQAMKGRVTVESRAGKGSCFSVALPLAP